MAIHKHEYELSIWEKELVDGNTINETKLQVIGAHDMTHLGRATNVHFRKLLNGTHVLTFQMPIRFFNSEVGDYVQNELIESLFNEQKIKLKFKNQWYEMVVKSINEKKNFKTVMKDFTCTDGFIDELSRTGYDIYLDPEANNSVNEIHDFMDETLENSIWDYRPEWNWGDFTEYKEERFYKIPLSLFGGSISAYKLTLDIPKNCLTDSDIKEIKNVSNYKKRPLQYGDDLAGVQKCFWNQQNKSESTLFKDKVTISEDYIYIPMSDLTSISTQLYENLDSAAQSTETYYDSALTKYALQPSSNNPKDIIQFIILPENDTYMIDDGGVLTDYNHTYILTIEDFNNQCKSKEKVYYKNGEGQLSTLTSNKYSLKSFMWKPLYNEGYLSSIGEKEVTKARKVSITGRTELNIYDDIYVNVYNNKVTDNDIIPLLPKEISSAAPYKNYRIVSKLDTEIILPTLARNYVLTGKTTTDTTGWESLSKSDGYNINISSRGYKKNSDGTYSYVEPKSDSEKDVDKIEFYSTVFINPSSKKEDGKIGIKGLVNFGFVGCEKNIEKEKTYALRIQCLHKPVSGQNKYNISTNEISDLNKLIIAEGSLQNDGNYSLNFDSTKCIKFSNINYSFSSSTGEDTYILFKSKYTIKNPYIYLDLNENKDFALILKSLEIFEAYTRGSDILEENYISLRPGEDRSTLSLDYKYSGRNIDIGINNYVQNRKSSTIAKKNLLLESDITLGNAYEKQSYYIQEKKNLKTNTKEDTFLDKEKWFEENNSNFSNTKYVETDFECNTYELNLNQCKYINNHNNDCSYNGNTKGICYYKKYGYCPYLFTPELHPRRIRTLQQSKSNRFNIIQELSKVFEVYPTFTIPHTETGKVSIKDGKIEKYVHFITEKGNENLVGFRYTKNLTDINRTLNSDNITTKLIVAAVDSQLSKTGYCTIQAARDNLGKNSFIFDFSYYTKKGLLNPITIEADLYGLNQKNELAYLKKIDIINTAYDQVKSRINALTDENYKTLKTTNTTNLNGISAAQEEIGKINLKMSQYKINNNTDNNTYKNYIQEKSIQQTTLYDLINTLFFTDNKCYSFKDNKIVRNITPKTFENTFKTNWDWSDFFEAVEKHQYLQCGSIGQEQGIQYQVDELTKISNSYLKQAKDLTTEFNKKYEAFIKEGTWSDSNYLTDNEYYWGGVSVLSDSSKPQTSYSISVIDITKSDIDNADIYEVDLADITYVEDEDFFGINKETGFANREKVLISEIDYSLDIPSGDRVNVQNYTTQFNDLFQQITASVQSLTYNENIYKRAQSFTAQHYVKTDSLQGTLNTGDLTLLNTNNSIKLNRDGTEGNAIQNSSSRYKLNGDGLFFSTNGGTTWIQAVSPKGLNMNYAKFGAIDVGKIKLVDSEYVYFLWDKNGIIAYNPNNLNDYSIYSKSGLSLYQNNAIRLRAGYQNIDSNGKETEINSNTPIGFYLYNEGHKIIFSTNTETNKNGLSARLTLSGEMYVNNIYYNGNYFLKNEVVLDTGNHIIVGHYERGNTKTHLYGNKSYLSTDNNELYPQDSQIMVDFIKGQKKSFSTVKSLSNYNENIDLYFPCQKDSQNNLSFANDQFYVVTDSLKISNKIQNGINNGYRCFKYMEKYYTIKLIEGANSAKMTHEEIYNAIKDVNGDVTKTIKGNSYSITKVAPPSSQITRSIVIDNVEYNFNRYYIIQNIANTQKQFKNSFAIYTKVQYDDNHTSGELAPERIKNTTVFITNGLPTDELQDVTSQAIYQDTTNNKMYTIREYATDKTIDSNTAIYINNLGTQEGSSNTRLLSVINSDKTNSMNNILTITANGKIHIGGEIDGQIDELTEQVNITNSKILSKEWMERVEERLHNLDQQNM